MLEGKGSRDEQLRLGSQHQGFLELCALAASGNLSEAEGKKLRGHLIACSECREAMKKFAAVVDEVIPELAPELTEDPPLNPSFSQEKAETSFRKRLADEKEPERNGVEADSSLSLSVVRRSRGFLRHFDRYDLWLPMAASVLLCVTLAILSYRTGRNHGIEWARLEERGKPVAEAVLANAPAPANTDLQNKELAARNAALADLRREVTQKSSELDRLKALASAQQLALRTTGDDKNGVTQERDQLLRRVSIEEAILQETQERLKHLEQERSEYVIRTASLESKIAELSNSLDERERLTSEQQDLLAKDRDIRELIGARDLYITEIFDVGRNGDTRKAAGRVFYTKGKSLIFYAYDLHESPGVKDASTFEAWGQRGSDWKQASKLGIFYEDNASKKRWVVKSNDRRTLDQIDAVFITVEPNGGSERPTGKPLLFAYLKVAPNHP
jgi:predicted  nucleic acid-binding Zn-ribbon protein